MVTKKAPSRQMPQAKKATPAPKKAPASPKKTISSSVKKAPAVAENAPIIYQEIDLKKISVDPDQPRKYFSQASLDELVDSVREHGVLQPITVRPKGKGYLVVFGERRYRAALVVMAAFKSRSTIMAAVRDLNDEATLELQIIENLQRKDVNPMEEAHAFCRLKDRGLTVDEIGNRVGKSPQFIIQRMVLSELIDRFQALLYADRMTLTSAFKIARYSPEIQAELYADAHVPADWEQKDWRLTEGWGLSNKARDLSKAPFSLSDKTLYPEAGACNKCPKNSAANPLLFPELNKKKQCHNPACFAIKSSRHFSIKIEVVLSEPDILFVALDRYPNAEVKAKYTAVQEMGVTILEHNQIEVITPPDHPGTWDDFMKSEYYNDDDSTPEENASALKECEEDYKNQVSTYEDELREYNETVASGQTQRAFVVTGNYNAQEGEVIHVRVMPGKIKSKEIPADASPEIKKQAISAEIAGIEMRERRKEQQDRETIYNEVMEVFEKKFTGINDSLKCEEWVALAVLLADTSSEVKDWVEDKFDIEYDYSHYQLYEILAKEPVNTSYIHQIIRLALFEKLVSKTSADFQKDGKAAAMYNLAQLWDLDNVQRVLDENQEMIDKRKASVEKRIAALNKKMSKPIPAENQ